MSETARLDVTPTALRDLGTAEIEADVVVVGGGCAGVSAAIEAAAAGADVVLLERTGGLGGASAMSGGLIYLGGGTSTQQACGVDDTPEEMFKFLMAATGPGPDEDKVRLYCDESVAHHDWLVSCGIEFKPSIYQGTFPEPETDDGLMYSGGEDTHPWYDIATPAPRAHIPRMENKQPGERSGGWMLMHHLIETMNGHGVRTELDITVDRLVVDDDGTVAGLVARRFGAEVPIRARRGVILAAGGFVYNDDMLAHHAPMLVGLNKLGTDSDDGRGILMAQAIGAAVRHMDASECAYAGTTGLIAPSIVVNGNGQRFINEDTYFGRVGQAVLFKQNVMSLIITDDETWENVPAMERYLQPSSVCETLEELEQEVGLPAGSLVRTVGEYNAGAEAGTDPLFGKQAKWLKPLRPPFAAFDLRNKLFLTVFTLGGLDTSVDGEVRNVSGDAIPGLYAAGRTTSGIPAAGYLSGSSLGDGTFFGRRAGRAAAARA